MLFHHSASNGRRLSSREETASFRAGIKSSFERTSPILIGEILRYQGALVRHSSELLITELSEEKFAFVFVLGGGRRKNLTALLAVVFSKRLPKCAPIRGHDSVKQGIDVPLGARMNASVQRDLCCKCSGHHYNYRDDRNKQNHV